MSTCRSFFPCDSADKRRLERSAPNPVNVSVPIHVVDRLGCFDDGLERPLRAHVGRHVRAVGDDRVGVAVEVAQRQVGERVRGRPRVRPDRRPQHERHARPARAGVGGGQREPAREPGHHRPVVARARPARRRRAHAPAAPGTHRSPRPSRRRGGRRRRRARRSRPRARAASRTPRPGTAARGW